jgi:hypothetical protein
MSVKSKILPVLVLTATMGISACVAHVREPYGYYGSHRGYSTRVYGEYPRTHTVYRRDRDYNRHHYRHGDRRRYDDRRVYRYRDGDRDNDGIHDRWDRHD